MKKLMKRVRSVVVLLLVLIVVVIVAAAAAVFVFADRVVRSAVESAGTKTLNVPVKVGDADVSILDGTVDLRDISVANPPGFEGSTLLKLQQVNIAADAHSLLTNEVIIKDMKLDRMEVFVEQRGLQNNLYDVIRPLREPHEPTGRSLLIDSLELTNITVHVSMAAIPGQPPSADFTLDKITMADLGRNEKIDTAVLIGKILLAVAAGVAEKGGRILPKETVGEISGILDKAFDIGKTILAPGGTGPDGKPQESLGQSVTEGLQNLLGGKKKEQ
jgi:uncharacterized protein involved in outer membrane biogenesis